MSGLHDDDEGFLKKFLDKSMIFDVIVVGVLGLNVYLLQQNAGFRASITEFQPGNLEITAAQATIVLIGVKIINTLMDMGGDDHR